ncbi:MAG: hypothetical protein HZB46_06065, partial [Solirubrobacterales bacterium]|nr:hypothetical protein [Solirubrobacterales bacterium]
LAALILAPLAALTDTSAERGVRTKLGLPGGGGLPCGATHDSPGWAGGGKLPGTIDEPRGVAVGGRVYLAGGTLEIVDYGKPSTVPGVPERVEVRSSRQVLRFDPRTREYDELAQLPEPLNHVGLTTYGGDVYLVGGHGNIVFGADAKQGFWRYSVRDDRWSRMPPMPTARGAATAQVIGDRLYVAGGMLRGRALRTLEAYDFSERRWHRLADMPTPREHVPGAVVGGKLYVAGGRSEEDYSLRTVDRYDPRRDRWEHVPDLPQPEGGGEAVAIGGDLLVVGGGDDREKWVTGAVQRFDPATGRWSRLPQMRTPRHGFAAAVVGERLWTFGGSPCALFAASDVVESFAPGAGGT